MRLFARCIAAALLALPFALPLPASAQPGADGRSVRLIVPFSAGSATDGAARLYAEHLGRALKVPVVVDNKPGASGIIAAEAAAKAPADGTTIFFTTNTTQSANPNLFKRLPYDAARDFEPVARLYILPLYLVTRPDIPAQNAGELVALSRRAPRPFSFAYPNSSSRLAGETLRVAGGNIMAIPYKANPQALVDLLGGLVDFGFIDLGAAEPHVKAGKLKIIGVMSSQRVGITPEIPAIGESVPGFDVLSWGGVYVPARTPAPVVQKLSSAFLQITADPQVSNRMRELGYVVAALPAREFRRFADEQLLIWRNKVRAAGIELE